MQNAPADIGKSNRIYSANERVYISSLLSHATAQQNIVRSRIADLERRKQDIITQIQDLQNEDDDINGEIDRYRIALAPHKRLPDDVLSEIFAWCVIDDLEADIPFRYTEEQGCLEWQDSSSDDGSYHADRDDDPESSEDSWKTYDSSVAETTNLVDCLSDWSAWLFDEEPRIDLPLPLILSQICSAWRRVALSMPLLWSSVFITSFTLRTKRLATEWLSRARESPVSITIYGTAMDSDEFDLFAELKDFLSEYHIKALELPLYSETCAQLQLMLSELSAKNMSQLERLSLVDVEHYQGRLVLLEGVHLPHLRDLEFVGDFKFDNNFILPWTSLRNLDMSLCHLPATDCLDIIRQCTSLQTCSLGISALPELPPTIEQSIHLPALYDLAVAFHVRHAHVGIFLQQLTIPCLTTLAICGIECYPDRRYVKWSDRDFSEMIGRSNCPLSHLTIENNRGPIDVGPLLANIPGLRLLTLDQARFDQDTLDRLAHGRLGPDLEHFTVRELDGVSPQKRLYHILCQNTSLRMRPRRVTICELSVWSCLAFHQRLARAVRHRTIMQNAPADIGESNRIYSADEEAYISSLLSRATAQQKQVRSRIADLERQNQSIIAQIQVLQDEEDRINTQINSYQIALAPHRRLPDDVLSEIFTWCVLDDPTVGVPWYEPLWEESSDGSYHPDTETSEDSQETYDRSTDDATNADDTTNADVDSYLSDWSAWSFDEEPRMRLPLSLILSHICSAWRRVAVSMPLLWSNVSMTSFTRRTKRLATEWLSRAGDFPVSITIYDIVYKFNLFAELKDFLLPYHIKSLELPLCSSSCPQLHFILSELPAERTSQLERLSLVDVENSQQSPVLLKGTWYPHLRELELVGNFKFDYRTFSLPWTSLHNLDIELCHLPAADCFDILRQCTSLQTCSLGISALSESTSVIGQSIHLPTLRDLSITFFTQGHIGMFFRPLTIPHLTTLGVSGTKVHNRSKWSDQDFSEMIGRSNCPLTYLTIEFYQDPIDVGPLLTIAPGLRLLLLDKARFDQDDLDRLAHGGLGRYLQHFTVCDLDGDPRKLWEMIKRRKENSEHNSVIPFISFSVPECLPED